MILSGIGSIALQEIGKMAISNTPILKQVATETAVGIAKKSFDLVLDNNPNFSSFLSQFGIHKFGNSHHSTFQKRGKHRRIAGHNMAY